jgi:hypothetical protein
MPNGKIRFVQFPFIKKMRRSLIVDFSVTFLLLQKEREKGKFSFFALFFSSKLSEIHKTVSTLSVIRQALPTFL